MKSRHSRTPKPSLQFDDVQKTYGDLDALGPVSLEVPNGQLVALVGHNGSGKSTMLAAAAGVLETTGGRVCIGGADAGSTAARAAVSYLGDRPILYDDLSLREQVDYISRLHNTTAESHDAHGLMERFGLETRADELPRNYSRGLRQKAAIVIALCRPFVLLLVDEPFSGLDAAGQDTFVELLQGIRSVNGSAVIATHDAARLEAFDRIVTLEEGQVVDDRLLADRP